MDQRLVPVEEALKAGRSAEAIERLTALLTQDPAFPAHIYRVLLLQFHRTQRFVEGEVWAAKAVERNPRDGELWNLRGVFLRPLTRYPAATPALVVGVSASG
jgi:hypothetical protein